MQHLDTVEVGTATYLLAAQFGTEGISSYRMDNATGALTHVDDIGAAQGLGINAPTDFETVTAFGKTWVIMGSAGTSMLNVLELEADGTLTAADQIMDTRETRFGGVQSVTATEVDGHVFVVAGGADDGLSLFTLMPDGRLIHLETIEHTPGAGLMNVGEIETSVVGGDLQIYVSSATDAGLTRFRVDLGDLGDVHRGDGDGAGTRSGGAGDDLMIAGQSDYLRGGDGDDILVGAQDARLSGGRGADRFVMSETGGSSRILDFTAGEDILDLSSYVMLRSAAQVEVNSNASGARVSVRDTVIDIRSSNGMSLDRDDLFADEFQWPDRIPMLDRDPTQVFVPEIQPLPVPATTQRPMANTNAAEAVLPEIETSSPGAPTPSPVATPTPAPVPMPAAPSLQHPLCVTAVARQRPLRAERQATGLTAVAGTTGSSDATGRTN
ncbi:hypothetical protein KDD17_14045 [Sulfitobacter albidus]|uniref:Calcium-binding protein n=1 Tax=Sulfitobacter albidus TaxID=2829501 RepID=A0A975JDE8_9RHOB|nr:calcium-binding protein [Sulfitobacter albidus]QUJ76035.1 hypothetical protein KDD17_14045 [Sulfitobacter albidus]